MKIGKLTPLITTNKLDEIVEFYTKYFKFTVEFQTEGFLVLKSSDKSVEVAFMKSATSEKNGDNYPEFQGDGITLTMEVENVDEIHDELNKLGLKIIMPLENRAWGDRSFSLNDPCGISLYLYKLITT